MFKNFICNSVIYKKSVKISMSIKNWKQYIVEQTTPVQNDTSVEQEMTQRTEDLERVRSEVLEINNNTTQILAQTDPEAIDASVEQMITAYENNRDSFVTLALTYMKTVADKKKIELRLADYANQIPELQAEMKTRTDQLNSEIEEARVSAEGSPTT